MTIWSVWGEISGVMAVLCLITALAAVTAAAILLIREKMTGRLWSAMKSGLRKGAGKVRKLFANETNIAEISRKKTPMSPRIMNTLLFRTNASFTTTAAFVTRFCCVLIKVSTVFSSFFAAALAILVF